MPQFISKMHFIGHGIFAVQFVRYSTIINDANKCLERIYKLWRNLEKGQIMVNWSKLLIAVRVANMKFEMNME